MRAASCLMDRERSWCEVCSSGIGLLISLDKKQSGANAAESAGQLLPRCDRPKTRFDWLVPLSTRDPHNEPLQVRTDVTLSIIDFNLTNHLESQQIL